MIKGHNKDVLYEHSLDHALEFYSKAGSLYVMGPRGRKPFEPYGGEHAETSALALFQAVWAVNYKEARMDAMKLLFWLRDCRGGAGNRSGFRSCIRWLATEAGKDGQAWLKANLALIQKHGRMDDLESLFGTPLEKEAAKLWANGILTADHYALKWAKRNMKPLQKQLGVNEAGLRKLLVKPERHTVEQHMCSNLAKCPDCGQLVHWHKLNPAGIARNVWDMAAPAKSGTSIDSNVYMCSECEYQQRGPIKWETIDYSKIPSKAMKAYAKAFAKHDPAGFAQFKTDLAEGKTKVNASVLFPHDCKHAVEHGDPSIADAQFAALPNYMEGNNMRIMCLADTSGSMTAPIGGTVSRIDVSVSLALYCSDRLGKDNPLYRKYMEFSSLPAFKDWQGIDFHLACKWEDGWCGSTDIEAALNFLLAFAKKNKIPSEQMVNCLIILSDMQFDQSVSGAGRPVVESCMKRWVDAGYEAPRIIYWNLAGYAGQPATAQSLNTALVSGFSPSVLKAILSGEDFSPVAIMRRTLVKYEVTAP